jgi:23S rRNA pseudouridine1911/1915/1917 synthase
MPDARKIDIPIEADPAEPFRTIVLDVPKGETPERIDQYLARMIANTSRSKVQDAIDANAVLLNGKILDRASYKIKGGDSIEVRIPKAKRPDTAAEAIPLEILYEDDDLIIINKPAGMIVHPTLATNTGTLVNALLHHIDNLKDESADNDRPGIVHRLDKDTSGLMVVAKNERSHRNLAKQFFDHTAQRVYNAICWGNTKQNYGKIETLIGRHPKDRKKFAAVNEGGKIAITEYFVVEELKGFSLIELRLKTGRTHQIRVHMQHIGHPVFGDATYGGRAMNVVRHDVAKFKQRVDNLLIEMPRQALHAKTLRIYHPTSGELMEWTSELPIDMVEVLEDMRSM